MDHAASRLLKLKRFGEAEAAYQQALALLDEFEGMDAAAKAGYQASTYHQLGRVAEEQRQWDEARACYLKALPVYLVEFQDASNASIVLASLYRLWQASGDAALPGAVGAALGISAAEAEEKLKQAGQGQ